MIISYINGIKVFTFRVAQANLQCKFFIANHINKKQMAHTLLLAASNVSEPLAMESLLISLLILHQGRIKVVQIYPYHIPQ